MFERDKKESNNLISPCCGLLRHVVEKVSYLRINVPHNDSEISSLAPCCGRGLGRGGENNLILSECEESHKIEKSYEILRFALALNGYGSAFQHLLVRISV